MSLRADPPPWEDPAIEATDVSFILVTGANAGVGFGICQRLIDEFLTERSLSSHLVLLPTTRNTAKSAETVRGLREYALTKATHTKKARARYGNRPGAQFDPRLFTRRIHILSVQLSLLDLANVLRAANQLVHGTVSTPSLKPATDYFREIQEARIPRLDSVVFNAGIGGWTGGWSGLDYIRITTCIFGSPYGLFKFATWPDYKLAPVGSTVNPLPGASSSSRSRESDNSNENKNDTGDDNDNRLGEVFCANVFGHYLLAHELIPLLRRPAGSRIPPGRFIWESSITPSWRHQKTLEDFQSLCTKEPYEGTKRLMDVLVLSSTLPAVRPLSSAYLAGEPLYQQPRLLLHKDAANGKVANGHHTTPNGSNNHNPDTIPPKIYLCHPGIVATSLMPTTSIMYILYVLALYLVRVLGSPWHPTKSYKAACAAAWLVTERQEALDALGAERIKWGSSTDRLGKTHVKMTEVVGWGWRGKVDGPETRRREDRELPRVLRRDIGRDRELVARPDVTAEQLVEFEDLGARCWREMERLRGLWEPRARAVLKAEED